MKINKKILTLLIILGSIYFVVYCITLINELPSEDELKNFSPVLSTKIYDRNNVLITELFTEKRTWIEFKDIPEHVKLAVLAIEDHTFYHHWGINPKRILKAAIDNLIKRKIIVGGSTITQQLAKTAFLTHKRSLRRKIKELFLALMLEHNFSKNEIFEMYLNQVYFGNGAYGIQQAARIYFSKNVSELTIAESAMLAGLISSPAYYSPVKHYERALSRRNLVLKRMLKLGFISKSEYEQAISEPLIVGFYTIPSVTSSYFIEYIKQQLEDEFPQEILYTGGLSIYTTLDLNLQKNAEEILNRHLSELDKICKSSEPVQGLIVALEVKTGKILTMVGGRDFRKSQFNRVTQAKRQPGSAFKPIIYLAALEQGFTPASIIEDTPLVFYNNGIDWELISTTTNFAELDFTKLKKLNINDYHDFIAKLNI